ncbi:MAG: molybdopterin cofactor-binding domain-containing protein, partial [Burkholderiaceae bacterium]
MSSAELTNGWSRRRWLQTMGGAGAGLVAALPLSGCSSTPAYVGDGAGAALGGFIQITPQNTVHFYQPRAEMGQGVYTGMTTLVAEELGVKPQAIRVHLVGAHPDFVAPGGAAQVTGGSTSMKAHYVQLRQVGANVREAIRQAAAQQLGLAADELKMQDGHVHHGTRRWPYGDFAERAASQPLPTGVPLKPAAAFDVIGKPQVPLDALAKVTGQAQFGLDVELP